VIDQKCTEHMGGEVARIIDFLNGKPFPCSCGLILKLDGVAEGYLHDGGYEDKDGKKWWLFLHCSKCEYDWAFWKIIQRVRNYSEKMEKERCN